MSTANCAPKKISKRRYSKRNSCKNTENLITVIEKSTLEVDKPPPVKKEHQPAEEKELEWCQKQTCSFMKCFKQDYTRFTNLYKCILQEEQDRERRNIQELDELKKEYNRMQVEETELKRKHWCRYCQSEANYLSSTSTNFYCSQECEKKQINFFKALQESFNASP